jgi:hypothetical protein
MMNWSEFGYGKLGPKTEPDQTLKHYIGVRIQHSHSTERVIYYTTKVKRMARSKEWRRID